jgi:hypothetical protein
VVTAVICLAPGLPSHLKQARSLLIGCTLGIVIGDLLWQLPEQHLLLRMSLGAFLSILLGAIIGPAPVVPIQAGVSVILVLVLGPSMRAEPSAGRHGRCCGRAYLQPGAADLQSHQGYGPGRLDLSQATCQWTGFDSQGLPAAESRCGRNRPASYHWPMNRWPPCAPP